MKSAYEDERRALAYSTLEFRGTYYLAYRDLPAILERHVRGRRAIDFGCGAGRSTRFLKSLGFETTGIDISAEMLAIAREGDPAGDYALIPEGDLRALPQGEADLVLAAFPFDYIPTLEKKVATLRGLAGLLRPEGVLINLVAAPEIYLHEWASFSTKDFPENRDVGSGGVARIAITDMEDPRPLEDVVCSDGDYRRAFAEAGLDLVETHRPLGTDEDPCEWVSETSVSPWAIYALRLSGAWSAA